MKKKSSYAEGIRNKSNRLTTVTNLRWDSDAKNGSRTSEEVLVHWLTDEENAEKYFGGSHGSKNQVNGIRKDEYHGIISKLIMWENDMYDRHRFFTFHHIASHTYYCMFFTYVIIGVET